MKVLMEGMKIALEVRNSSAFKRYDAKLFQTVYLGCEPFPLYSDEYLRCIIRVYTTTIWHPVDNC